MNTHPIATRSTNGFSSILNGLVTAAFTLAVVGMAGVLTIAQYLALA